MNLRPILEANKFLSSLFGYTQDNKKPVVPENEKEGGYSPDISNDPYGSISSLSKELEQPKDRQARYKTYELMDGNSIVATTLDAYAEEAVFEDYKTKRSVWITSDEKETINLLTDMFDRIRLEGCLLSIARYAAKMGDDFEFLPRKEGVGILGIEHRQASKMDRIDDGYLLRGFRYDEVDYKKIGKPENHLYSDPWDYIHFRVQGRTFDDDPKRIYGSSLIHSAIKAWQMLDKGDLSMLLYRMKRAPDRLLYKIPAGSASPEQQLRIVRKFMRLFKKNWMLTSTGMKQEFNPFSSTEDIYWPVGRDKEGDVTTLSGSANVGDIKDIEYLRQNLASSLRVYLDAIGLGPNTEMFAKSLVQLDYRFARVIKRLRKALLIDIHRMCQIELALHGKDPRLVNFEVNMSPLSYLDKQQNMELQQIAIETADRAYSTFSNMGLNTMKISKYVLTNFVGMSEEEAIDLIGDGPEEEPMENKQYIQSVVEKVLKNDPELSSKVSLYRSLVDDTAASYSSNNVMEGLKNITKNNLSD